MFNRLFGKKSPSPSELEQSNKHEQAFSIADTQEQSPPRAFNFLERTKQAFNRLTEVTNERKVTPELWEELEETLLQADIGPSTIAGLLHRVQQRVQSEQIQYGSEVRRLLQEELALLLGETTALQFSRQSPMTILLIIGVNGSGKTTSIAKLAALLKNENHRVLLAAADTFRAAAIDQLQVWGERAGVPVISHEQGSDPGAVVFDALQYAQKNGNDVVLIDTAGRLHTKYNLMEELKKLKKVIQKFVPDGPHELLIVIDATTGQNALLQARKFAEDIGLTGVIITKLDGSSKGGFAFAVADDLGVPIKFVGTGEKLQDIAPFHPDEFVSALFA